MGSDGQPGSADFVSAVPESGTPPAGIAGSVNVIRQQFEQVIVELRISQLATQTVEERLGRDAER